MGTAYRPAPTPTPPSCEPADAAAIQALNRGNATPEQQKRGIAWIIEKASGTYDTSYREGAVDAERATIFAEGRRFVGNLIIGVIKVKLGQQTRRST